MFESEFNNIEMVASNAQKILLNSADLQGQQYDSTQAQKNIHKPKKKSLVKRIVLAVAVIAVAAVAIWILPLSDMLFSSRKIDDNLALVQQSQNPTTISAGENHTVALKSDGTVVATGNNEYGQCDVSEWKD